jgi:hypothetical protein
MRETDATRYSETAVGMTIDEQIVSASAERLQLSCCDT